MNARSGAEREAQPEVIKAIPARHPWRWVATAIVLIIVAALVKGIITSPNFGWDIFRQYFFSKPIMHGLGLTIVLTIAAMVSGVLLGIILALMRLSPAPVVSDAAWVYVWFFRGTPLLVQILFWFNIAALTGPHPALSLPFTNLILARLDMNAYITPVTAGVLALGLNEGAYMSEIVRAGILSVDEGQFEAASSVGMTRLQTMRLVVLPQAMRVIIPPTGNETISMLKTTSLVSIIAVTELLQSARDIYAQNYQTIPLLIVAMVWYLILTSVLSIPQYYLERRFARGASRNLPPTPFQKFRAMFARRPLPNMPASPRSTLGGSPVTSTAPMVLAEGVRKSFGHMEVLKGIDLEVDPTQVVVIIGPSGSGKSTFLRCINHLEKINGGRLSVDGELVGYRQGATSSTSCTTRRSPRSGPRSGWCSSASTCSRT